MTTDDKKLLEIERILNASFQAEASGAPFDIAKEYAKDILSTLKQFDPEPLEVCVLPYAKVYVVALYFHSLFNESKCAFISHHKTEQQAIDFCAKHGLRVK